MVETTSQQPLTGMTKPTIPDVVEEIGFGRSQLGIITLACGCFLAEGLELLMVSLLSDSIAADLENHESSPAAYFVFWVLLGTAIGNAVAGPIADLIGRQHPMILGYFMVVLFSMVSSFMNSFTSICTLRFFVGMGFGLGQPAALVLMSEVTPRRWRLVCVSAAAFFLSLGALFAVVMVMLNHAYLETISMLEWRLLLRCSSLPVIVLGFVSLFALPESPQFLAATGDFALARDSLQRLAVGNQRMEVRVQFRHSEAEHLAFSEQLYGLMSVNTIVDSVAVSLGILVLNFALYGCSYIIPQEFVKISVGDVLGIAPASILVAAFALACFVIVAGSLVGSKGSAKVRIILCLLIAFYATLLFNASMANAKYLKWSLVLSSIGLWCAPAFAICSLIQVTLEMYPVLTSATFTGLCLAFGRIGAVAAPLTANYIVDATGDSSHFFVLVAALEFFCVLAFLPADLSGLPMLMQDTSKDAVA